ncbi:MAG TPA: hypothetical protein VH109_03335 [Steroidobacteraceae bacterium]|jgi:hypothetical protein|nr:hypothetical protein [Steroidobacteraceae bacterium]
MRFLVDRPVLLSVVSFACLWLCAWIGSSLLRKRLRAPTEFKADFVIILSASLTLLGLIIGFTFSMATSRYDLRKANEASEANAIGTEYVRADLLPSEDAERIRVLLKEYLQERIGFYTTASSGHAREISTRTEALQKDLWAATVAPLSSQQKPVLTLVVSGMNDVLNSQAYTQAAWINRIPTSAWLLLGMIAVLCNLMVGYNQRSSETERARFLAVLPLVVAVAFFLISDIDSPRGGVVRVTPQNLLLLSESLR